MCSSDLVLQCSFASPLNNRTIGERIAERHAQLNNPCARPNRGQRDFACGREIGIAAGDVGDESGTFLER